MSESHGYLHWKDLALAMSSATTPDLQMLGTIVQGQFDCRLVSLEQWAGLARLALRHGMGPLLFVVLRDQGCLGLLPRDALHLLFITYGQSRSFNDRVYGAVEEWSERFAANDIAAIWLKGVTLGLTAYSDRATRPMTDADVLTQPAQTFKAMDLLEAVTGVRPARLGGDNDKEAMVMVGRHKAGPIRLELHWSLLEAPSSPIAADIDWFLKQSITIDFAGRPLTILRPEAHLLYLCAHALLQHGEGASNLLRYYDFHQLITASPDLDWSLLLTKAVDFGWTDVVERGLSLSQTYFGTTIPAEFLAQLQQQQSAARFADVVESRRTAQGRWAATASRLAVMTWPARTRLAWGLLFPPLAYMRYRYHLKYNWQVVFHYPYRWWHVTGDMISWFATILRSRR